MTVVTTLSSNVYHLLPLCHIYTEVKVEFSNRMKPSDIKFVIWSKLVKSMHVLWWRYIWGVKWGAVQQEGRAWLRGRNEAIHWILWSSWRWWVECLPEHWTSYMATQLHHGNSNYTVYKLLDHLCNVLLPEGKYFAVVFWIPWNIDFLVTCSFF
jgi:hypothetical protein